MRLVWKVAKEEGPVQQVVWEDGSLATPVLSIEQQVGALIDEKPLLNCGAVGPFMQASLSNEVAAYGTIRDAIRQAGWLIVGAPPLPAVEPDFSNLQSSESGV